MVFGFGFNKTKTLASAEKNVKAGKLTQALADYEKLLRHDPNDVSSLNTAGDLYASTGNVERATECFRQVATFYASTGFAVKAIAIYKKLLRNNPSAASTALAQMGELYAGLRQPNEARAHYLQAATQIAAENDLAGAAVVLQKALELDTENAQVIERLRDLLPRLGKKNELRDIYMRAAQNHRRQQRSAKCRQALEQVLKLDPKCAAALLLAAELNLEAGDASEALRQLSDLPDLNTRAEALRMAVRALLLLGNLERAEAGSVQLLTTFRDWSGFTALAEWSARRADFLSLLAICQRHGRDMLAADRARCAEFLDLLGRELHSNVEALESIVALLERAGDGGALVRGLSRLAFARQHAGDIVGACQLYERLAELEPTDPAHRESLRMIREREQALSGAALEPSAAEAPESAVPSPGRPEEDEFRPPAGPERDDPLSDENSFLAAPGLDPAAQDAVSSALTDADLYASYRLHEKAILTLEAVLPQAERDLRVQHQLADLYAQVGRLADAARGYGLLADLCAAQGHENRVLYYRQCAARYREQAQAIKPPPTPAVASPAVAPPAVAPPPVVAAPPVVAPPPVAMPPTATPPPATAAAPPPDPAAAPLAALPAAALLPALLAAAPPPALLAAAPPPAAEPPAAASAPEAFAPDPVEEDQDDAVAEAAIPEVAAAAAPDEGLASFHDLLDEAKFYLSQAMIDEATSALTRAAALVPESTVVAALRERLEQLKSSRVSPVTGPALEPVPVPEEVPQAAAPEAGPVSPGDSEAFPLEVEASSPTPLVENAPPPVETATPAPPIEIPLAEVAAAPLDTLAAAVPPVVAFPAAAPEEVETICAEVAASMDGLDEIDLFEIEMPPQSLLESPLLPIETMLATADLPTAGDSEDGEELLADVSVSAPLEPRAALIPLEHAEEVTDWVVIEEEEPPPVDHAELLREIDPHGEFEELFLSPTNTDPPATRSRRRP